MKKCRDIYKTFFISVLSLCMIVCFASISYASKKSTEKSFAFRTDVQQFIKKMVDKYQFDEKKLMRLFSNVKPMPRLFHKLDHPREELPWYKYKTYFMTNKRVNEGVQFWAKHRKALDRAEKVYGVPPELIVAIIGIESNYGQKRGQFPVFNTLSNIVFNYHQREKFFTAELINLLLLCREQSIDPLSLRGSYAGAIGEPQFMPSSIRRFAVDFSHTGHIDIMHDEADVIGSVANYFNAFGWKTNQPVIIHAKLGKSYSYKKKIFRKTLEPYITIAKLKEYGVKPTNALPKTSLIGLIRLRDKQGYEYWISLHNFYVIKHYNRHVLYAIATYELSEKIKHAYYRLFPHKQQDKLLRKKQTSS